MNKFFTLAFAAFLGLSSMSVQAQTKLPPRKPVQPRARVAAAAPNAVPSVKDGVMMKEGKVYMTQSGITSPLTQETSLVNGTKITADGTVTMTNGTTATLKEGDYMSLSGRLTTAASKAQQDSLMQAAKDNSKSKSKSKSKKKG